MDMQQKTAMRTLSGFSRSTDADFYPFPAVEYGSFFRLIMKAAIFLGLVQRPLMSQADGMVLLGGKKKI